MNGNTIVVSTLALAVALGGCAGMSDTQQRVGSGAAIGGLAVGALTGDWGWAAAGAAAGAAGGYLVDQQTGTSRPPNSAPSTRACKRVISRPPSSNSADRRVVGVARPRSSVGSAFGGRSRRGVPVSATASTRRR